MSPENVEVVRKPLVAQERLTRTVRLIADLLALVDAGLVTPVDGIDDVRYAPADSVEPAACAIASSPT
jgi:hypothetical protein